MGHKLKELLQEVGISPILDPGAGDITMQMKNAKVAGDPKLAGLYQQKLNLVTQREGIVKKITALDDQIRVAETVAKEKITAAKEQETIAAKKGGVTPAV